MTLDELVVKISSDIGSFEKGMDKAKKRLKDLGSEDSKVKISASDEALAQKISEAKSKISEFENTEVSPVDIPEPNTDDFENGMDDAEDSLTDFEKSCNDAKHQIEQIFGAVSFGKVAKEIGDMAMKCAETSSELTEVQNVVDVAFGSMSHSVDEWAQSSITSMGISEYAAKNTASNYMSMGNSMGLASAQAAQMSLDVTRLSADMASFYNTTQQAAGSALKGIWTGETEALKTYGITMTETNLQAFAMSEGIKTSYNEMSQAEKVMLRYQYVMQAASLAQGDFANTSGEYAGQQRILSENINVLQANMGQLVIAGISPVLSGLNGLIQFINGSQTAFSLFQASIIGVVGALAIVNFQTFLNGIQKLIAMCHLANSSFGLWAAAITSVVFAMSTLGGSWGYMSGSQQAITAIAGVTAAAGAAAVAMAVFHASISTAAGVAIVAGMLAAAASAKLLVGNVNTSATDSAIDSANNSLNTSSYSNMSSDNSYYGTSGSIDRSDRKKASGSYNYASKSTKVTYRASGGFPDVGEVFISREAGPEMVGTIGGSTAVMNNDQIVAAVSKGVAKAVSAVMKDSSQSTPITITLDGDTVYRNQIKVKNRRGYDFNGMGDFAR